MLRSIEAEGVNCDEAIENALRQLQMDRDDVSVEVLTMGKKGIFRSVPAKVRVSFEVPDPKPEPVKPAQPVQSAPVQPKIEPAKSAQEARPRIPAAAPSQPARGQDARVSAPRTPRQDTARRVSYAEERAASIPSTGEPAYVPGKPMEREHYTAAAAEAVTFIDGLLDKMGVDGHAEVLDSSTEAHMLVTIVGPNMGPVIGRRGDTLDAIQYLTMLVVDKNQEDHVRISVDTENYRAKREESLTRLARKMAVKVSRSRQSMTLEPMNPYERRIIHAALQDFRGVTTFSTGTEPGRRVVIAPEGQQMGNRGGRRR